MQFIEVVKADPQVITIAEVVDVIVAVGAKIVQAISVAVA